MLAYLCNRTGLEASFHRVEMCKSMSHRVFPSFIQVEFHNLPKGDPPHCVRHVAYIFSVTALTFNRYHMADYSKSFYHHKMRNSGNVQINRQNR